MPKKRIIIFITTFIIVGIIILVVYSLLNKKNTTTTTNTNPWYQGFNPFGSGGNTNNNVTNPDNGDNGGQLPNGEIPKTSKFFQITDFAIAGATFLDDTRPIINTGTPSTEPQQVKITIDPATKDGRKDIQTILNQTLSLKPALVVDGNFGKKVTDAIKSFQKLNNIAVTGIIDADTAPFFTKVNVATNITPVNTSEQAPSIRFIKRMDGHLYKMFLDTKEKEQVSNSTIPSIYEAFFNKKADTVIYRYLSANNVISSFVATLGAVKGEFLPQDISNLSVSRDGTKFFYVTKDTLGGTGTMGTFGDTKREVVFNSPFTEWLSDWDNTGRVYITTKPSYGTEGSIFLLNPVNKTMTNILGGVVGLTTMVNGNGSSVLYSTSTNTGPKLGILNISNHNIKDLNTYGLPEKCVWSSDNINVYCAIPNTILGNQYPDTWYQGLVSFDDYFVKINTVTGDKVTIANSKDETSVDGTYLFLNKKEDTLFFTNKKDSTLWGLQLN